MSGKRARVWFQRKKRKTHFRRAACEGQKTSAVSTTDAQVLRRKRPSYAEMFHNSTNDFAVWYTPGVVAPCREIQMKPYKSFELTNRWNYVAVVTDGTRVLGLGDIGPETAMPEMEGKALLSMYLGGVDAFPICIKTKDPDEIVHICELLEPSFGGINLEDIENPKCFSILEKQENDCRFQCGTTTSREQPLSFWQG